MPDFACLPQPLNANGKPRLVGVEIELGGMDEASVAQTCADTLGGKAIQGDGPFWTIENSEIGEIEIYLDIFLRNAQKSKLRDLALDFGREVVPVEIVTEPLDHAGLCRLDDLRVALREAGGLGSGAGWFFGFGLHLNIEIASDEAADIVRPLMAYALIEDWIRTASPIDESRRVLPFTDPYPTDFVRALIAAGPGASIDQVTGLYLKHTPSRNRGLDMLPIFAYFDPDRIAAAISDKTSARPTFHFRLPDCRIDEADWSIADEWNRWLVIERVAQNSDLLAELAKAWDDDHGIVTLTRKSWAARCGTILKAAGLDSLAA